MNKFVAFAQNVDQVTVDNLLFLCDNEKAVNLYNDTKKRRDQSYGDLDEAAAVKKMVMRLTVDGIFKYGSVLCIVEVTTLASIYCFKLMIDLLKDPFAQPYEYKVGLFAVFCVARFLTVLARSYYDTHVYNYFRFVQTRMQCWLFELVCGLKQWQGKDEKKAQVVNILTKDIEIFVIGSWQFPYLLTVPINTCLSAAFLFSMFGWVVVVCYAAMGLLLLMQYYTNDYIAKLQYAALTSADRRIQLVAQIIKGIKAIKCRVLESLYVQRVDEARERELSAFSQYCNIKNICAAIYFNAGIIISALVFLLVDKSMLDLGKVFSTLALLGYIFNFSILYSNYAIESLFAMQVFNKRVEEIVTQHVASASRARRAVVEVDDARAPCLAFNNVTAAWSGYDENPAADAPLFRNMSIDLSVGQKVAIIGPVGAGKTSLLMLVLGEMPVQ